MTQNQPPLSPEERKTQRLEAMRQIEEREQARRDALTPEQRAQEDRLGAIKFSVGLGIILLAPVCFFVYRSVNKPDAPRAISNFETQSATSRLLGISIPTAVVTSSSEIIDGALQAIGGVGASCNGAQEAFVLNDSLTAINAVWSSIDQQGYKREVLLSSSVGGITKATGPKNLLVVDAGSGLFICES